MRQGRNTMVVEQGVGGANAVTWGWWTAATAIGGTLGELILRLIESALGGLPALLSQIISWSVLGLVLGTLQWLVLRRVMRGVDAWIPATALAGAVAYPIFSTLAGPVLGLGGGLGLLVVMFGLGLVFGGAQALVLQRVFRGAWAWAAASAVAWPFEHFIAIYLARAAGRESGTVGWPELIGWAIYGGITGLVLLWLLRRREVV